jgi:hypothetical protein
MNFQLLFMGISKNLYFYFDLSFISSPKLARPSRYGRGEDKEGFSRCPYVSLFENIQMAVVRATDSSEPMAIKQQ